VGFTSKKASERLKEHNLGATRWTLGNRPFNLLYYESYYCEKDARHRELFLKSGQGKKLVRLIKENY
jgi:predicted GIY-YIG superfamily endonuclease